MSERTKTTDAQYLSEFSSSPYVIRASERVVVQGRSELRGSWLRAKASAEIKDL